MSNIKDRQTFLKYAPTSNPVEGYASVFIDPTDDLIKVRDHQGNVREFAEQFSTNVVWRVGDNEDFETVNDALKEASKKNIIYDQGQIQIKLLLASGFVMREQVTVVDKDLSFVVIESESEIVTIDRSSITEVFEDQKAVFNVKNGKLPRIDCSFEMDESGTADNQNGIFSLNGGIIFEDGNSFNKSTGTNITARGGTLLARSCEFNDAIVGDGCDIGRTANAFLEGATTNGNNRDGVACDTSALVVCRNSTSNNNGRYGYASFNAGIVSIPFSEASGNGSQDVYMNKGIVSDDTYLNLDNLKVNNIEGGSAVFSENTGIDVDSPIVGLTLRNNSHGIGMDYITDDSLPLIAGIFTSNSDSGFEQPFGELLVKARTQFGNYGISFITSASTNSPETRMRISPEGISNFQNMPQVGGNPVVESGSNSDGEWVRFADGTQIVFRVLSATEVGSTSTGFNNTRFDYPVTFIERPIPISQSGDAEEYVLTSSTAPDSFETRDKFFFVCRNASRWNARLRSSISNPTSQVISAFGRWY